MRLNGRVSRLEARLTATAPADDAEVELWARFFASARRWPEDGGTAEDHIRKVDRRVAREFFAYCRSTGEKPGVRGPEQVGTLRILGLEASLPARLSSSSAIGTSK